MDDCAMDFWQETSEAQYVQRRIRECTEELLATLNTGESLAVHVECRPVGPLGVASPTIIFQVLTPGKAPTVGYEWTVYGPKV